MRHKNSGELLNDKDLVKAIIDIQKLKAASNKKIDNEKSNEAYVYAPKALEDLEKTKAKNFVTSLIGEVVENINFLKEESLIDGLKVTYKDKLWDFSLKSQLDSIVSK